MIKLKITKEQANKRVDIALAEISEFSRSMIQKIIIAKKLYCNQKLIIKANKTTQIGEIYELTPITSSFTEIIPEKYELDILFEDESLIVLNKPAELIVHPGAGHFDNTLVNKLAHHCTLSNINGPEKLGIVHRLDKGVSGCIIVAKDNLTHINLNQQFEHRKVKKNYIALSHGHFEQVEYFAQDYIARSQINRKKMAIFKNYGKLAQMHFLTKKIIETNKQFISLIECHPITGRMHQIRLQLSSRKLPILNDPIYGKQETKEIKEILKERIALHARTIEFIHPKNKKTMIIEAKIPEEFLKIITKY